MQTLSSLPTPQLFFSWQTHLNGHDYLSLEPGPFEHPGSPAGGHLFTCRFLLLLGLWWLLGSGFSRVSRGAAEAHRGSNGAARTEV